MAPPLSLRPYLLIYAILFAGSLLTIAMLDHFFSSINVGRLMFAGPMASAALASGTFVDRQGRAFNGNEQHQMVGWSFALSIAITLIVIAAVNLSTGRWDVLDMLANGSVRTYILVFWAISVALGALVGMFYLAYGWLARMMLAQEQKKRKDD